MNWFGHFLAIPCTICALDYSLLPPPVYPFTGVWTFLPDLHPTALFQPGFVNTAVCGFAHFLLPHARGQRWPAYLPPAAALHYATPVVTTVVDATTYARRTTSYLLPLQLLVPVLPLPCQLLFTFPHTLDYPVPLPTALTPFEHAYPTPAAPLFYIAFVWVRAQLTGRDVTTPRPTGCPLHAPAVADSLD